MSKPTTPIQGALSLLLLGCTVFLPISASLALAVVLFRWITGSCG